MKTRPTTRRPLKIKIAAPPPATRSDVILLRDAIDSNNRRLGELSEELINHEYNQAAEARSFIQGYFWGLLVAFVLSIFILRRITRQ